VIEAFDGELELPAGEIGEIIVRGGVVTKSYENNDRETRLAKIKDQNTFWHRMGDTGYLDEKGRLWFCGRRAHRVITRKGVLFTIPCEAIFNTHPNVFRSALVGVIDTTHPGYQLPVLIIETMKNCKRRSSDILEEIRQIAGNSSLTKDIKHFLFHDRFPVDIRHNAKIFREKLALWADREISKR
jgi:acyl-CoA synthetase (AMP-forming)/AMP-acid ligase II